MSARTFAIERAGLPPAVYGAGKVVVVADDASREAIHGLVVEATTAARLPAAGLSALALGPGLGTAPAALALVEAAYRSAAHGGKAVIVK